MALLTRRCVDNKRVMLTHSVQFISRLSLFLSPPQLVVRDGMRSLQLPWDPLASQKSKQILIEVNWDFKKKIGLVKLKHGFFFANLC